jgi:hypothetical protein
MLFVWELYKYYRRRTGMSRMDIVGEGGVLMTFVINILLIN